MRGFDIAKTLPKWKRDAIRLTFDSRPYAGCRDIEIIILDGRRPEPATAAPAPEAAEA